MTYFSILQRNNLTDGLKFIGRFASIFHNFWTDKKYHDARFIANDDIAHGSVIRVSYQMISTGHVDGFIDEVEHTNAAIDLYSYYFTYNSQQGGCRKAMKEI